MFFIRFSRNAKDDEYFGWVLITKKARMRSLIIPAEETTVIWYGCGGACSFEERVKEIL